MMATVQHVTTGLGLRKFQADGFLLTRVYHADGRTDGQTDMTMLIIAFLSFVDAPNNIMKTCARVELKLLSLLISALERRGLLYHNATVLSW